MWYSQLKVVNYKAADTTLKEAKPREERNQGAMMTRRGVLIWWCVVWVTVGEKSKQRGDEEEACGGDDEKKEPELKFRVPKNGSSVMAVVEPEVEIWVHEDHRVFAAREKDASMCCRLDGSVDLGCHGLESTSIKVPRLHTGWHELNCGLYHHGQDTAPFTEARCVFRVVDDARETDEGKRLIEIYAAEADRTRELQDWWHGYDTPPIGYDARPWVHPSAPRLVVGVKCAAGAIAARDAFRRTWFRDHDGELAARFIVGRSELTENLNREAAVFGDVLIPEVDALFDFDDAYQNLIPKTLGFLAWALREFPTATHFFIVDDDVLVDVQRLLEADLPTVHFYAGQVWAHHFNQPKLPQRDPTHRNYLPRDVWPLSELPPFAIGPHYLLSKDCAHFLASNRHTLRGLGTLEDVSVALWLLSIGVHPSHSELFSNARLFGCVPHAVSLADLTPLGILSIHANRQRADRDPCFGFDELAWVKVPRFTLLKHPPPPQQQPTDSPTNSPTPPPPPHQQAPPPNNLLWRSSSS